MSVRAIGEGDVVFPAGAGWEGEMLAIWYGIGLTPGREAAWGNREDFLQ